MGNKIVTSVFYFEGIDCPNCASKIERALDREENIASCNINYVNQKIVVEHNEDDDVFDQVLFVAQKIEPDVKIYKDKPKKMYMNHKHNHHYDDVCDDRWCVSKGVIKQMLRLSAIVFFICGAILQIMNILYPLMMLLFVCAYIILAKDLLLKCFNSIKNKDFFNENTLMVIASFGALCIGEGIESIMVVLLNRIGEYYQDKAIKQTKSSIKGLFEDENINVTLSSLKKVSLEKVKLNDVMIIKPGEKIYLDGILLSNDATLDMKSLTGEALPINIKQNQEVLSGSINYNKVIEVKVTKLYQDSTISKVKRLIEEANDKKSKSQIFITKFARIYTPIIILLAIMVCLLQLLVFNLNLHDALNSMFSILVIACPCALVISIPLCYFLSIGACSKEGILVKGGNYLEALTTVDTFIFDKTGTLTKGNFVVKKIVSSNEDELLDVVNKVELHSSHPIALAIKNYCNKNTEEFIKGEYIEYSGKGTCLKQDGHIFAAGNSLLMEDLNVSFEKVDEDGTLVYVSKDNVLLGYIVLGDEIKEEAKSLIAFLKKEKYQTYLLSGDNKKSVDYVGNELKIDNLYHSLLPQEKYSVVEKLKNDKCRIVYIGDGINDSPSLKLSDVGISMGAVGSDISKECSDVIIMNDDIGKVKDVIKISKFTKKIVIQNIVMILLIKVIAIVIGATGILGSYAMLVSIFSDVGVCLLSIFNTLRITKKR